MLTALDCSADATAARLGVTRKLEDALGPNRKGGVLRRWREVAECGRVSRRDLKPELFGNMLQFVALVEVMDGGEDYRTILEGREIVRWFGKSDSERFSVLYEKGYFAQLRSFYLSVQLTGRPNSRSFMTQSIEDEGLAFSQLVLPAMDDQNVVRHLAVVFDFPDVLRRIPVAPLRMFAPWKRLSKGVENDTILGERKLR